MKTVFNSVLIDEEVTIKSFREFNSDESLNFLVFKFHRYFDGLIGLDILRKLKVTINFGNSTFKLNSRVIPIHYKPNVTSKSYTVNPNTKIIVELPVDIEEGDILIERTIINPNLIISCGIYHANNWFASIEVSNISDTEQLFVVEQPIKAKHLQDEYSEFHNYCISSDVTPMEESNKLSSNLRLNHLNPEEKHSIIKLCNKFSDIFFTNENKLTFTNQIKHQIKTNDDIPIYSKSYRYPFVCPQKRSRNPNFRNVRPGYH